MINIFLPTVNPEKAQKYGDLMMLRARVECNLYILEDIPHKGWVNVINEAKRSFPADYYVYAADDAYPGRDWLREALDTMKSTGAGLVGFNEGKFQELNAGFGLVKHDWIETIYGGDIFHSGYKSHYAEPELTHIARAQDKFTYNPRAVLVEVVFNKDGDNSIKNNLDDERLFFKRLESGFDGRTRPMIRTLVS